MQRSTLNQPADNMPQAPYRCIPTVLVAITLTSGCDAKGRNDFTFTEPCFRTSVRGEEVGVYDNGRTKGLRVRYSERDYFIAGSSAVPLGFSCDDVQWQAFQKYLEELKNQKLTREEAFQMFRAKFPNNELLERFLGVTITEGYWSASIQ